MSVYHLMRGIEHDEDNSVSAEHISSYPANYGPTYDDALSSLIDCVKLKGHTLVPVSGWLFAHIPCVEGVFKEEWKEGDEAFSQIWLIKHLTPDQAPN